MAYESKFKNDDIDELFRAVLLLEDEEDCYRFFEDICTINEIHAIAQRLQVAKLLSENRTYNEIESITKASTATISRISAGMPIIKCRRYLLKKVFLCSACCWYFARSTFLRCASRAA